ncbi:MAG: hypothetical protein ACI4QA_00585 [Candidatus Spyradosoma sp.]
MSEEKYLTFYKEQPWDIRKTYGYVFHAKARERVTELLRAIAKRGDIDRNLDIGRCRRHDAIFVNGGRGVGKTVFLTQADTFLSDDEKKDEPKLYFLPVLEPSLLDDTVSSPERFIAVAVAQVNEVLEETHPYAGSEDGGGSALLDEYGKVYRDVAEAISGVQSFMKRDGSGADDLFSMQSVISLERSLHRFFGVACRMLKVKALILRFDDVDMACGIGFCVLEAIRKYLATPYVVPMVSGDLDLYQRLCENHFREKLKDKENENKKDEDKENEDRETRVRGGEKAESLTESYLQKVLPADRRVELHALGYGMASGEIKIDGVRLVDGKATTEMKWEDAKACLDFYAFGAMKNERYRRDALPDSVEHKECFRGTENLSIPLELPSTRAAFMFLSRIFDVLKDWKEKGGENSFSWEYFRIFHEAARDVTEHVKAFEARQEAARVNALASADGKLRVSEIFRNLDFKKLGFEEEMAEDCKIKTATLRSATTGRVLGHREILTRNDLRISVRRASRRKNREGVYSKLGQLHPDHRFLWALFVLKDYYSSSGTRPLLVLGGRFFEYVFSSFDSDFNSKAVSSLLSGMPFGSSFRVDVLGRKKLEEDRFEDDDDNITEEYENIPSGSNSATVYDEFPKPERTDSLLRLDSYFISEVAKRYFENLVSARKKISQGKEEETLFSFMRRCAYILVNAVAGVEQKEEEFSPARIASGEHLDNIESSANAWTKNVNPLIKDNSDTICSKVYNHPLVNALIKNKNGASPKIKDIRFASDSTTKLSRTQESAAKALFEISINGKSQARSSSAQEKRSGSGRIKSKKQKTSKTKEISAKLDTPSEKLEDVGRRHGNV